VELRDCVCFHDHRFVAHDAVALTGGDTRLNASCAPAVIKLAIYW